MKILTILITLSISGGVLATERPGSQSKPEKSVHKKMRTSAAAEAVIDLSTRNKTPSKKIEMNTLAHRALPGVSN